MVNRITATRAIVKEMEIRFVHCFQDDLRMVTEEVVILLPLSPSRCNSSLSTFLAEIPLTFLHDTLFTESGGLAMRALQLFSILPDVHIFAP
jgi:hypothetical protein